jgi:hypothetical protein
VVKDVVSSLASAHADLARGDTRDDRERQDISRDYRSGCDDAPFAERDTGKDRRARPDPHVVLDHYPSKLDTELRIVDAVGGSENRHFRGDADVVPDPQRPTSIEAAVAIDPRIRADVEPVSPKLIRTEEPDVAAQMDSCVLAERDPEDMPVPATPQREARDVADDVVREVIEDPDAEEPGRALLGLRLRTSLRASPRSAGHCGIGRGWCLRRVSALVHRLAHVLTANANRPRGRRFTHMITCVDVEVDILLP